MTTVRDLLQQTEFSGVWDVLQAADADAEKYRQTYQEIYDLLRGTEPDLSVQQMTIRLEEAEEPWFLFDDAEPETESEEGENLQLSGYLPGDEDAYAIGVRPPAQIVAMAIDPDTLAQQTPAVILAYCITEIIYSRTTTQSVWSPKMDTYAGGLYAAATCSEQDMGDVSLDALRREMGLTEEPEEEDNKSKYGFLF